MSSVIDSTVVPAAIPTPDTDIPTTKEVVDPTVTVTTVLLLTVVQVKSAAGSTVEKVKVCPLPAIDATVANDGIPVPATPIPTTRFAVVSEFILVAVLEPTTVVKVCIVVLE